MKSATFFLALCDANWPILRLISFISAWICSVRVAYRLRIAPGFNSRVRRWLAHALNGRRVGGVACKGDLGVSAVSALAG